MSLYLCSSVKGTIPEVAKTKIANDITSIHCRILGTVPSLVHVFFFEDVPEQLLNGKAVFLFSNIVNQPTSNQKKSLIMQIRRSVHVHTGLQLNEVMVDTSEIPEGCVMNGEKIY